MRHSSVFVHGHLRGIPDRANVLSPYFLRIFLLNVFTLLSILPNVDLDHSYSPYSCFVSLPYDLQSSYTYSLIH
jgi:hypothetical protein